MPTEVAYHTGGTGRAMEMTLGTWDRTRTEEQFEDLVPGMNGPFIADLMSKMVTHERCGLHLYTSVAGRSNNPMLKRKFEQFGEETARHVELLEGLIGSMGGDPMYVSPMARAAEKLDMGMLESTFMLSGSIDPMTQEALFVEAVLHAETTCRANWQLLAALAQELPEGPQRDAAQTVLGEVLPQEDEHLGWAAETREKMMLLQARSSFVASMGDKAERMMDKVKSLFD